MLPSATIVWQGEALTLPAGAALMRRAAALSHVLHLDAGRVALRLLGHDGTAHQMGMVQGPCWLNATCAVLGQPPLVDAVAETEVQVRRVALAVFQAEIQALPATARTVLHDVALAHRQQTELAVSRLAKDAEARCAEWLLRHAEPAQGAPGALLVMLRERKRMIAAQLGIAPETLSRVLRQLRERSLISGTGRVLNLLDPGALRLLAGLPAAPPAA
ncbi:MAG: Crp/Fnr family transcriptional regulator [Pseudomonadota bacterium]|nr:Crp/Fnr family transcriptional regulator [Pseudomonadota bacterium]